MKLETTLNNAKGEALNSLFNATKNHINPLDSEHLAWINEISNVHGWLCSKFKRMIIYDLDKEINMSRQDQRIYLEMYRQEYNKY